MCNYGTVGAAATAGNRHQKAQAAYLNSAELKTLSSPHTVIKRAKKGSNICHLSSGASTGKRQSCSSQYNFWMWI